MSPKLNPTIRTYDKIAKHYFERRKDRSAIGHHLARFVQMIEAYQLAGLPVIDIGCGPGFDAAEMRTQGLHCIGLDLSSGMLETARQYYPNSYLMADMLDLPIKQAVGGLWCCASLLHLPRIDMPKALDEFYRVLVPGGVLYLSVKRGKGQKWSTASDGKPGARLFTLWEPAVVDGLIEGAGFQIIHSTSEISQEETTWLARFAIRSL